MSEHWFEDPHPPSLPQACESQLEAATANLFTFVGGLQSWPLSLRLEVMAASLFALGFEATYVDLLLVESTNCCHMCLYP